MATAANTTYAAFQRSYSKVIRALPIEDLIPDLFSNSVISGDLKAQIEAKPTKKEKTKCLLDSFEGGLSAGYTQHYLKFLRVLEEYSNEENDPVCGSLAKDVQAMMLEGQKTDDQLEKKKRDLEALEKEPWYYSNISRTDAELMLKLDGDYIVRRSALKGHVITVQSGGVAKHYVIEEVEDEVTSQVHYKLEKELFPSVQELLHSYETGKTSVAKEENFILKRAVAPDMIEDMYIHLNRNAINKTVEPKKRTLPVNTDKPLPALPKEKPPFPLPKKKQRDELVLIEFDYEAQGPEELSLTEGELITVLFKEDDIWWCGKNSKGKAGMFPAAYIARDD